MGVFYDVCYGLEGCVQRVFFRQLRNRDAAVRSRERKKAYVKDLEMKSRYLEGECRRLGHLLQCCYAENNALRLCLQSRGAYAASMTSQESAVLLLGKACYAKSNYYSSIAIAVLYSAFIWVTIAILLDYFWFHDMAFLSGDFHK